MKNYFLVLVVSACLVSCNESHPPVSTNAFYEPIPTGYGYMQENSQLEKAIKDKNQKVIRQHAWKLWAGIMQPAKDVSWPVWYTWPNTYGAFLSKTATVKTQQVESTVTTVVSMIEKNKRHIPHVDTANAPVYPVPDAVKKAYPSAICGSGDSQTVCDGPRFVFNGDIMIPTESLSIEGFEWIRSQQLYKKSVLDKKHEQGVHMLEAPQKHIVTKHMYWPVLQGQLSALPVWQNDFSDAYTEYAGYEKWNQLVAIDPSGKQVGEEKEVSYLYGVYHASKEKGKTVGKPYGPITKRAKVYGLDDFYYQKISQDQWDGFSAADKAIINAASYWAYNKPFGPGDYLVTIAMHINTKEIPSWALQSVWWSDTPDNGQYADDRPELPQARGPWTHYLMVDAYGVPDKEGNQPVAYNPYIELVIHPVATNCNNCHIRAGWPTGHTAGTASYQNPDCPDLLATLSTESSCLKSLSLTDFQWIIPDRAK